MNWRISILFFAVVAIQVAGLIAFAGMRQVALTQGREVVLQTVPVDPRSLLQGDYAILDYEIARLPDRYDDRPVGVKMCAELTEHEGAWRAARYTGSRPPNDGKTLICGQVDRPGHLDFGIGTYFVPEGTGHIIERARDVKVVVAIGEGGNAVIKRVLVDGEPFDPATQ